MVDDLPRALATSTLDQQLVLELRMSVTGFITPVIAVCFHGGGIGKDRMIFGCRWLIGARGREGEGPRRLQQIFKETQHRLVKHVTKFDTVTTTNRKTKNDATN